MLLVASPQQQFGGNLRAARARAGVPQVRLAAAARMHRTEVSLLERGERDPRLSTIVRLARALDVTAAALVEGVSDDGRRPTPG